MKLQTRTDGEVFEGKRIEIIINDNKFTITEDKFNPQGGFIINKTSDGETDAIFIKPNCSNEITIG
jgi:hypothetical protein